MKSYYAIIPANVRYDTRLTPNAKLLYGEITALCNEKGFCWAGNEYFAELYGVSKVSISKWISQLAEYGYIQTRLHYKEGSKQILNRYISLLNDPIKENFNTPIKENFKDNNTNFFNNTFNSTVEKTQTTALAEVMPLVMNSKEILTETFDYFWRAYPKKTGKRLALKAWLKEKPPLDAVLFSLQWQKDSQQWYESGGKYIPNPTTYINQARWEDEKPSMEAPF